MQFVATFILLSVGGLLDAGYLFIQHKKQQPLVCPLNHDCSVVTESKWSKTLGMRNEILGFIFYVTLFGGILATLFVPEVSARIYFLLFIATAVGVLFSLYFTALQIFVIRDYCFYCLISALLSLLLFLNSIFLVRQITL